MESQHAPKPPTVNQELALIAFSVFFLAIVLTVVDLPHPDEYKGRNLKAGTFLILVIWGFGHAAWISTSLRRHGHRVGAWKFFAFFLGPIAAIFHLTRIYHLRAVYMILLYFGVYGVLASQVIILRYLFPQ